MIDLEDESSWPDELIRILKEYCGEINAERELDPYSINTSFSTKQEIENVLLSLEVRSYHCTKLTDFDLVRKSGLSILKRDKIKNIILRELRKAGLDDSSLYKVEESFENYAINGGFNNRESILWFVLTKNMVHSSGCLPFFTYFGGEVTRDVLNNLEYEVFPLLSSIGTPAVVECCVPIKSTEFYQVMNLANEFIYYGIQKYVKRVEYNINAEICVNYDISPEYILDVWIKE